jgi:hypothetical protein
LDQVECGIPNLSGEKEEDNNWQEEVVVDMTEDHVLPT